MAVECTQQQEFMFRAKRVPLVWSQCPGHLRKEWHSCAFLLNGYYFCLMFILGLCDVMGRTVNSRGLARAWLSGQNSLLSRVRCTESWGQVLAYHVEPHLRHPARAPPQPRPCMASWESGQSVHREQRKVEATIKPPGGCSCSL